MIISDGADRDRGLPESYGIDDLPIVLQDKRFSRNGGIAYEPDMMDLMHGFQGDTVIVNGAIGPVASVPPGYVRLRLLNAANARVFDLRFSDRRPFFVIAGDGGLLAEPVEVRNLAIAPAERYEVLVDFADGRAVDLVTAPDARHGMGMMMPMMRPGRRSEGAAELVMRFKSDAALKATVTRLPRQLATLAPADVKSAVAWRTFELDPMMGMGMMGMGMMNGRGRGDGPAHAMGINGRSFAMDRIDVTARLGTAEIWEISAGGMPMAHPFHVHGARFRILSRNGRNPPAHEAGWKDVVLVEEHAEVLVRFDNPAPPQMPFMYHCHILEHEDQGMMGQLAIV
jgi:FtsP/CotA-like multicopper oxidase with cupredoxin domain